MPLLLVTNDDGIHSPGLRAAVEAVLDLGEVVVAAPSDQQTAMSRSLTGNLNGGFSQIPFQVQGHSIQAFHCPVSPALIVRHALHVLFPNAKPDLCLSGINYGENVGRNVTYSGTLGAAMQASSMHVPAMAVSLQTQLDNHFHYGEEDWAAATAFSRRFALKLLRDPLPDDVDVLSINVPKGVSPNSCWRVTRLSRQTYFHATIPAPHPGSRVSDARLSVDVNRELLEPDSDVHALYCDRVVSVTPISLDLTSRTSLPALNDQLVRG